MANFKLIKWNSTINAIICLILGVSLLLFPIESLSICGYLIASILMLSGVAFIIKVIKNKGIETNGDIIYLVMSIAFIIVSITIFVDPTWIIRLINIVVGIVLLISSTMNLVNLLKFKKDRTRSWYIYLVIIILVMLLGLTIIIDPLFLAKILTRLEGATLIINTLITLLLARKVNKNLLLLEHKDVQEAKVVEKE